VSGPEHTDSGDVNGDPDPGSGDDPGGAGDGGDRAGSDDSRGHAGSRDRDGVESEPWASLSPGREAVARRLADYDSVLEVGVGRRPEVAAALDASGLDVTAVDVREFAVPERVAFVQEDVVKRAAGLPDARAGPEPAGVEGAENLPPRYRVEAIYALNLPPELHRPTAAIARAVDAAFLFTTLGGDPATVPVRVETLERETLYVARE
jgi:hypothetical protein